MKRLKKLMQLFCVAERSGFLKKEQTVAMAFEVQVRTYTQGEVGFGT